MIRSRFSVALGAAVTVLSFAPAVAQVPNPETQAFVWPSWHSGVFQKVDTGILFEAASEEDTPALLTLAGTELVLIREPMAKPEASLLESGVTDFVMLPAVNNRSQVLIATATGLHLGNPQLTVPPTITFTSVKLNSSWNSAVGLCAAPIAGGGVMVAARSGNTILRAQRSSAGVWTTLANITLASGTAEHLAIADIDPSRSGIEVAYINSSYGLRIHDAAGTQIFSYDHGTRFRTLARNAGGGLSTSDSFCFVAEFDLGGFITDILCEVTATSATPATFAISSPIFSGSARYAHCDFASIGADSGNDFVMASSTTQELVVVHGLPQGTGYPYTALSAPEFLFVSTAAIGLTGTRLVAADDFDGDGDGDLVVLGANSAGRGIWFFRGATIVEPPVTWSSEPLIGIYTVDEGGEIEVNATVDFPAGWGTPQTGHVDKMRVRVWVQDSLYEAVSEVVARPVERITGVNGVATLTDWIVPTSFDPLDAILHFEFKPMRIEIASGAIVQTAPATFAAAAVNGELYATFICEYPDEFNPPGVCTNGGSPIILGVNRRRIIMPTSISPQPQ